MAGSEREVVDVVDEMDQPLGVKTLSDCQEYGLLHRAVMVFLQNSKAEIFLQQRSLSDDWLPGKWTASCTGHVKSGEPVVEGARREVSEELGLDVQPQFRFKLVLPPIESGGKIEREIVFVFDAVSDGTIELDRTEVERGMFLSQKKCKEFFAVRERDITQDAVLCFKIYSKVMEF